MIEWAYLRKGCESCNKAKGYFEEHGIEIDMSVEARKVKIDAQKAWELIRHQNHVYIAKGQKQVLSFIPGEAEREEILKHALGRTGNLRAPAVIRLTNIFIGFNQEIYSRL